MNSIAPNESQWEYLHQGSWHAVNQGFLLFQQADLFEHVPLGAKVSLSKRNPAFLVRIRIYMSFHELCKGQAEIDTGPDHKLHVSCPAGLYHFIKVFSRVENAHTSVPSLICTALKFSAGRETLRLSFLSEESLESYGTSRTTWTYVLQCKVYRLNLLLRPRPPGMGLLMPSNG